MRDDQILQGLEEEIVTLLTIPEIEGVGVAGVLPTTSAETLIFREVLGQLPAIGVIDAEVLLKQLYAIGSKRKLVTISWELAIAVRDESEPIAPSRTVRRLFGECNRRLDNVRSSVPGAAGRYVFSGFVRPDHPRPDLAVGTVRYQIDAIFGEV